ncbi:hypothetical protein PT300_14985 [Enterobacteriaceae bacterium ESL0689]|nr:hypothetical protein [Enterobacteriaceae bacterium ESL0689]
MAVNLKQIPPPVPQPRPPLWWLWLLLLIIMLLAGVADTLLRHLSRPAINTGAFWSSALGLPVLGWLILLALRVTWYKGQSAMAHSRNREREHLLRHAIQRGQRHLNILAMSLHSALREPDDAEGEKQWQAFSGKEKGLKTQPTWHSDEGERHSRLIRKEGESDPQMLSRMLTKTLQELTPAYTALSADIPLTLLLDSHSSLPAGEVTALWQASLVASGIRAPSAQLTGSGLAAVDQWLDDPRNARALLLIIAIQVIPQQTTGSAESVVGLLLAGQVLKSAPIARLHRPEKMHHTSEEDFRYALNQALEWVPIAPQAVSRGFLAGVNSGWHKAVMTGLQAINSPINAAQALSDFGETLGYPGPATPWVAVSCAAACYGGEPQLIISGDNQDTTPLWITMVTPPEEDPQDNSCEK